MKRALAFLFAAATLTLSLMGCADKGMRNGYPDSVTSTDTVYDQTGGSGTREGTAANNKNTANNSAAGNVAGAVNRAFGSGYRYGDKDNYGIGGPNSGTYTAKNNGGLGLSEQEAAAAGDRYARMLENGRVHDRDGWLLDGENTSYRTM